MVLDKAFDDWYETFSKEIKEKYNLNSWRNHQGIMVFKYYLSQSTGLMDKFMVAEFDLDKENEIFRVCYYYPRVVDFKEDNAIEKEFHIRIRMKRAHAMITAFDDSQAIMNEIGVIVDKINEIQMSINTFWTRMMKRLSIIGIGMNIETVRDRNYL